jgi:hypothetical protein
MGEHRLGVDLVIDHEIFVLLPALILQPKIRQKSFRNSSPPRSGAARCSGVQSKGCRPRTRHGRDEASRRRRCRCALRWEGRCNLDGLNSRAGGCGVWQLMLGGVAFGMARGWPAGCPKLWCIWSGVQSVVQAGGLCHREVCHGMLTESS